MNLLKFIMFSSLEYFSSFMFILLQFRFTIRGNIEKILLISVLLSFVSYSFIETKMLGLSPLIQNIIFLVYIWMILKVSLLNSLIMLLTGYTVFGMIQTCFAAVFYHLGIVSGDLVMGTKSSYLISICSSISMVILGGFIYFLKGGFSFIENRGRVTKKMTGKDKLFVIYILVAFIVTLLVNIYMLDQVEPPYLLLAALLTVVLIFIFYLTFKRDESVG
ncbi:hypothetical protein [Cohnella caldifontis]|uniref:hypothetical protein n=1 Tax=Cohnella caldifontis TaxID=3027471 RepID=UPI0023EA92B5|nr:hypothetical protein [Cohnella sp. YIM B05605]